MKGLIYQILVLSLLAMLVNGCKKNDSQASAEVEKTKTEEPRVVSAFEKVKDINLTINYTVVAGAVLPPTFADTVKKAQDLLTKVFSSKDFRDELYKRNFHDSAYSKSTSNCFSKVYGGTVAGRSIGGKAVYDNLLPNSVFSIGISIRNNGDNTTTLGSASACGSRITTNDYWLKITEKKLAFRLARHWAHEYTHIRGYRHDTNVPDAFQWGSDVNKDPAYGVGDVVGDVLDKWITTKVITY